MALQKDINTQYGITLSYWKVARLNIDWHNKIAEVFFAGWPSQQARDSGVDPLEHKSFVFKHDSWPFTFDGNNLTEAYNKVKAPINEDIEIDNSANGNLFVGAIDLI